MVLTTHDGFDPRVLNKSADHAVALIQQLNEKVARALSVPATSRKTSGQFRDEILNLAANAEDWANTSASSAAAAAQSAADAKTTLATHQNRNGQPDQAGGGPWRFAGQAD